MVRRLALALGFIAGGCQRLHVSVPDGCGEVACPSACEEGKSLCGGACVNLTSDPTHCGECATACPKGDYCVLGQCSHGCAAPLAVCIGDSGLEECIDIASSLDHCGGCGESDPSHVCLDTPGAGTTAVCDSGVCGWQCEPGLLDCGDHAPRPSGEPTCTARDADNCNCGTCGNACDSWSFDATSLTCGNSGPVAGTCCGGGCIELDNDMSCGTSCNDLVNCTRVGRNCCPTSPTAFGCVSLSDVANCHACGNQCSGTQAACCPQGCVDLAYDPGNCGACGIFCAGAVAGCCPDLLGHGSCTDLWWDVFNCGTCGNDCYAFCEEVGGGLANCLNGMCQCF